MDTDTIATLLDMCVDRLGALRNDLPKCGIREDFNDSLIERCKAALMLPPVAPDRYLVLLTELADDLQSDLDELSEGHDIGSKGLHDMRRKILKAIGEDD